MHAWQSPTIEAGTANADDTSLDEKDRTVPQLGHIAIRGHARAPCSRRLYVGGRGGSTVRVQAEHGVLQDGHRWSLLEDHVAAPPWLGRSTIRLQAEHGVLAVGGL